MAAHVTGRAPLLRAPEHLCFGGNHHEHGKVRRHSGKSVHLHVGQQFQGVVVRRIGSDFVEVNWSSNGSRFRSSVADPQWPQL